MLLLFTGCYEDELTLKFITISQGGGEVCEWDYVYRATVQNITCTPTKALDLHLMGKQDLISNAFEMSYRPEHGNHSSLKGDLCLCACVC